MSVAPMVMLRDSRLNKRRALEQLGLNPYPSTANRTHYAGPIVNGYEEHEGKFVTVSGRLMSLRKQGGLIFGHLQDETGKIQLFVRRDNLAPTEASLGFIGFADLTYVDVGDIVEASGVVAKTKSGEISVQVRHFRLLTKSLRPLPDKWSGLKDREQILRKRYLDTTVAPQNAQRFAAISKMLWTIRSFLHERGFLEFVTPVLQPQYGGGTAKPFRTHVNALDLDAYLAISHELYLKRLIIAGYDKVYTIGKYFRNEGIDRSHHPEFSMVETMTAYQDYTYNMELIESMFKRVAQEAFGRTIFQVRGHHVDFAQPWRRVSMVDVVKEATGVDFSAFRNADESNAALKELGLYEQPTIGHGLVSAFESRVESELISPTLVYGHPMEISPLAKPSALDPRFAERFEIFIGGMECGDNWSEQNDPIEQLALWRGARSASADESETHPLDYDFVEALEYGMPPTTGIGPGIERMAMIFTGEENIDDVIFFPLMRPVVSQTNREIYQVDQVAAEPPSAFDDQVPLSLAEIGELVQQDILSPQSNMLVVRPFLRIWKPSSSNKRLHSSGYIKVEGFFRAKPLLLVGYANGMEHALALEDESRRFVDFIDRVFIQPIKQLRPNCIVQVSVVALVEDPG
jgi:lysyl-tRNA synthetase, class II